jgi:hypothetical protein
MPARTPIAAERDAESRQDEVLALRTLHEQLAGYAEGCANCRRGCARPLEALGSLNASLAITADGSWRLLHGFGGSAQFSRTYS